MAILFVVADGGGEELAIEAYSQGQSTLTSA